MAYEKQTWQCGDTITADKLNHMEDGIANVDVGYSCSEEWVTLTDESVTTTVEEGAHFALGGFTYSDRITADEIKVTFNSVEYTCQKIGDAEYGAPYNRSTKNFDWSEYPFNILLDGGVDHFLATETAGTYQIKIEAFEETIETSECFGKAVKSVDISDKLPLLECVPEVTALDEINNAIIEHKLMYFMRPSDKPGTFYYYLITGFVGNTMTFNYTPSDSFTVSIVNGLFHVQDTK